MYARRFLMGLIFCLCLKVSLAAVTVGTCQSGKKSYTTISAAIAAAPAGGVVNVCPGTYAEQLLIDKPLTIQGVNGTPTIVSPSTGLNELPAESGFFPQVLVNDAGGQVRLLNLSIDGSDALFNFDGVVLGIDAYCPEGVIQDFVGVYFVNTPGVLGNVNVSGQFGESFPGGFEPQLIPNCGSGIEFHGSSQAIVLNSTVSDVGLFGIFSDGDLIADHNVVSGGNGPFGVGISAGTGKITNNTVTGTVNFQKTTGIEGGDLVTDNVVQTSIYGISGTGFVMQNTLQNNAISISGITLVFSNQISAPSTYYNPACFYGACDGSPTGPAFPTDGIDFGCNASGQVMKNTIQGVGIAFANVPKGETIRKDNTLIGVQTVLTNCSQ
jgi:hypothetical protein